MAEEKCLNPSVSIIIPVYNVSKYIDRCLKSVFKQSYKNLEVVVVNDCTPDDSMRKVRLFKDRNSKYPIRIVDHPKNLGLSASRNTGIKNAKGEYLYFLDSDDEITTNCIQFLVEKMVAYGAEMAVGNYKSVPEGWFESNILDKTYGEFIDDSHLIKKLILERSFLVVTAWNRLVLKSFIEKNNLYFKEGVIHEDEHWNFFLAKHLSRLAICVEPTYVYYKNQSGIMHNPAFVEKSNESWKIILKDLIKNIDPELKNEQVNFIISMAYLRYNRSKRTNFEFIELLKGVLRYKWCMDILLSSNRILGGNNNFLIVRIVVKYFKIS